MYAVIDEFRLVLLAQNEKRWHIALGDVRWELEVHLLAVIERTNRTPRRLITRNVIPEIQALERYALSAFPLVMAGGTLTAGPKVERTVLALFAAGLYVTFHVFGIQ